MSTSICSRQSIQTNHATLQCNDCNKVIQTAIVAPHYYVFDRFVSEHVVWKVRRKTWNEVLHSLNGNIHCTCNEILTTMLNLKQHFDEGHFDVVYKVEE